MCRSLPFPDDACAAPEAVVAGDFWRITVLTDRLIRLEYSSQGLFTDKVTQTVVSRRFPVPEFSVKDSPEELVLTTGRLRLTYNKKTFSPEGLQIAVLSRNGSLYHLWNYGDTPHDLGGTARTLDRADGAIPLGCGLMSKEGWSVIDDSGTVTIERDGWIGDRADDTADDFYFFGYGREYITCLKDFYTLTGATPLLPRFALGNWWSRYYRYTQQSYLELMDRFDREDIPFTVSVIDMDWHLYEEVDPKYSTAPGEPAGWTGYTWNRRLFPDPKGFMKALHDRGRKVTLNIHPADGIRGFEDCYPAMAAFMGVDAEKEEPVRFQPANRRFMEGYFSLIHHPMEADGVDFWWVDWQQGTDSGKKGLDPLWLLNHYHYLDNCRGGRRGLIFSRYAGPGSHRYPVGFSGDTVISWKSLDFQPRFTASASNIGYSWWSHDIGGHMLGVKDDEMALRWFQLGVFSPIFRLHSTCEEFNSKEPWQYNALVEPIMKDFLRLRHRMIPYLHTMNRRTSVEKRPLIEPMYYRHPWEDEAYTVPNQYYFGTDLIACPITSPADRVTGTGKFSAWLPEGTWIDFFTGLIYKGGRRMDLYRDLYSEPVLAKAGAIIPLDGRMHGSACDNPAQLEIRVFAGGDGRFSLWEDDGAGSRYDPARWAETPMAFSWGSSAVFRISPAEGNTSVLPRERQFTILFTGVSDRCEAEVSVGGVPADAICSSYDASTGSLRVELPAVPVTESLTLTLRRAALADNRAQDRIHDLLNRAQMGFRLKSFTMDTVRELNQGAPLEKVIKDLKALEITPELLGAVTELLTAR